MANVNKAKGDRAERAVRDWAARVFPGSFKTRAGFNDDLGDIVVDLRGVARVVLQVKDVATPSWREWFTQLASQVLTCRRESGHIPVLGGLIVHKARGQSDAASWRAVGRLEDVMALVDAAYVVGHARGHTEGVQDAQQQSTDRANHA